MEQAEAYGEGEELVVVVVDWELVLGVDSFTVVLLEDEEEPPVGDGFTTVVLFSVFLSGGLTVSDFCSHAASNAAPAIMQMIFFIG